MPRMKTTHERTERVPGGANRRGLGMGEALTLTADRSCVSKSCFSRGSCTAGSKHHPGCSRFRPLQFFTFADKPKHGEARAKMLYSPSMDQIALAAAGAQNADAATGEGGDMRRPLLPR